MGDASGSERVHARPFFAASFKIWGFFNNEWPNANFGSMDLQPETRCVGGVAAFGPKRTVQWSLRTHFGRFLAVAGAATDAQRSHSARVRAGGGTVDIAPSPPLSSFRRQVFGGRPLHHTTRPAQSTEEGTRGAARRGIARLQRRPPLPWGGTEGAFSHCAGTAALITVFIPGNPLHTTPLQRRA